MNMLISPSDYSIIETTSQTSIFISIPFRYVKIEILLGTIVVNYNILAFHVRPLLCFIRL